MPHLRKTARQRYTAKKAINCEWLEGIPWPVPLPAGHGIEATRNGQVWNGRGSEKAVGAHVPGGRGCLMMRLRTLLKTSFVRIPARCKTCDRGERVEGEGKSEGEGERRGRRARMSGPGAQHAASRLRMPPATLMPMPCPVDLSVRHSPYTVDPCQPSLSLSLSVFRPQRST